MRSVVCFNDVVGDTSGLEEVLGKQCGADGCERYLLRPNGLFHDVAPLSASRQLQATEHRSLRREQGAIFGSLQTTGAALRSDLGVSQLRATTDNVLALFVEYVTFMKPLADRSVS